MQKEERCQPVQSINHQTEQGRCQPNIIYSPRGGTQVAHKVVDVADGGSCPCSVVDDVHVDGSCRGRNATAEVGAGWPRSVGPTLRGKRGGSRGSLGAANEGLGESVRQPMCQVPKASPPASVSTLRAAEPTPAATHTCHDAVKVGLVRVVLEGGRLA